jgi:hypothetical protein
MKLLIALSALVLAVAADGYDNDKHDGYGVERAYGAYTYHGRYPGKCGNDGLYYRDEKSFVFCSNGNSYVQPCAPGSRNSAYGKYSYGGKYDYRDFCDVNLVDEGYAAKHSGYGYNRDYDRGYGYGRRDYGYGGYDGYGYGGYGAGYGYAPRGRH